MPRITFLPSGISVEITAYENLLKAAITAGVHVNASCGGAGVCNKCRVFIESGEVNGEELPDGGWKACKTLPLTDITIRVPAESEMDKTALARPAGGRASSWLQAKKETLETELKPAVSKMELTLPEPTIQDNIPDLARIRREISQGSLQGVSLDVDTQVLSSMPETIRRDNWKITASLMETGRTDVKRLINVESGNRAGSHLAVAVDIGTTTVSALLIDLNTGKSLAEASDYNPQISYGEDVISRMEFSRRGDGLKVLKQSIVRRLDNLVKDVCQNARVDVAGISLITVAANTVMCHFLMGIGTKHLREHPYTPVASLFPPVRCTELGLDIPDHVRLFLMPCVASYVGGDIVAGVVGTGMNRDPELTLFIDIGTNGEIVLGNRDWMACAACSAGPAFEGGGIKYGMRATSGAVEVVHVQPGSFEPMPLTINGAKARGICGSGIISLLAGLFMTGALDPQGKFCRDTGSEYLREGPDGWEYLVVRKENAAVEQDIVFTEADVENLIRAKGAMFAGYLTLLESVGMVIDDLDRVILAGNFGSYIDLEQAITIGFMPDIPRDRFFFAGNSSLLGARAAALSWPTAQEMKNVARMMTHFDLSDNARFMDHYVSCLFLPHTDTSLFPSVSSR